MKTLLTLSITAALAATACADGLYDIPLKDIDGKDTSLKAYEGKVLLIVNVASRCGNTPQYTQLQALHQEFAKHGLSVLGFPCNDFGAQEPGTPQEILEFCDTRFNVTFPLLQKQEVNGPGRSALYRALVGSEAGGGHDIEWNFAKFVVGPDGQVKARFAPTTSPEDPALRAALGL